MSFFWKRGGSQASQIATPTHQSEAERLYVVFTVVMVMLMRML